MKLIECALQGEALKQDIESTTPTTGVAIWWLGQSGFLVKNKGGTVLFDPYLSDSLTKKYASTDKPHVRMTQLSIQPDWLTNIDVVTSTHNHTDHLDAETLKPLFKTNPDINFLIPEANRDFVAERLGCEREWPIGFTGGFAGGDSKTIRIATSGTDIKVHCVPAAHNEVDRDEKGRCHYVGYVITLGDTTIYHSGDTMMYDGMVDGLKPLGIDIAILPINGYKPERRVSGNLFGDEAARLAKDIGAKMVIPCHYDMFTFNTETTELFTTTCESLGQAYQVLRCGERFEM